MPFSLIGALFGHGSQVLVCRDEKKPISLEAYGLNPIFVEDWRRHVQYTALHNRMIIYFMNT